MPQSFKSFTMDIVNVALTQNMSRNEIRVFSSYLPVTRPSVEEDYLSGKLSGFITNHTSFTPWPLVSPGALSFIQ